MAIITVINSTLQVERAHPRPLRPRVQAPWGWATPPEVYCIYHDVVAPAQSTLPRAVPFIFHIFVLQKWRLQLWDAATCQP